MLSEKLVIAKQHLKHKGVPSWNWAEIEKEIIVKKLCEQSFLHRGLEDFTTLRPLGTGFRLCVSVS